MLTLFKVLKALFRFIREIWLRDRTFRQFVRENLSLIVTSLGFMIMTFMFTHVYFIVKDQEDVIAAHESREAVMQKDIDHMDEIKERRDFYREHYYEMKARCPVPKQPSPQPTAAVETPPVVPKERAPSKPRPKQPAETPAVTRPPSNDLVERWKKLSQ